MKATVAPTAKQNSMNTSVDSNGNGNNGGAVPAQPQRQSSYSGSGSGTFSYEGHTTDALSVVEQFNASIGRLCQAACTVRGRHALTGILRQQNERVQIIFNELAPHIGTLALDMQGCHVVRTLLDYTTPEQNQIIVSYLTDDQVLEIATNSQHSRRILQSIFERFQSPALDRVVMVIAREAGALAATQQGCITVMQVVENGLPHQRNVILEGLVPTLAKLTMDPYGNYVVQAVLDHTDESTINEIVLKAYRGYWLLLSCNKFASNVMEKIVRTVSGNTRTFLIQELVLADANALQTLVHDGFGNFVIQAIIDSATSAEEVAMLAEKVRPVLGTSPYAHRIEARLKGSATGAGPAHQRHNNAQKNRIANGHFNDVRGEGRNASERERPQPIYGATQGHHGQGRRGYDPHQSQSTSNPSSTNPTSSSNASSHDGVAPHVPLRRRGGR
eukprot:GILK01015078.1.p1 GENE.GILK01015078.1~~GILK01015078.1.p1  ORF type:complete len:471 (+),score=28.30 GILK01015078.1:81-1415(+)